MLLPFLGLLVILSGINCFPEDSIRQKCGRVHLTVSSQSDTYLEMNWITDCSEREDVIPDYIILSDKDLRKRNEPSTPYLRVKFSDYPEGFYRTKMRFGHPWLPGNWEYNVPFSRPEPGKHCFPYWIASMKRDYIIDSDCLAINPTWMNDTREFLGRKRLGSLAIPGTHNSGSFQGVPQFLQNYVLNQDRNIWTQLVFGIRYLDFRVGYYGNEGFFVNHDLVRITKILPLFREIRKFVELAPKEIIIIDFHRFPYPSRFNLSLHQKFVNLVYEELGDLALPAEGLQEGKGPTMDEIWSRNKNLIICHSDRQTVHANPWLWDPINQYWADTKRLLSLKKFLQKSLRERKPSTNPLWALMAELTPQPLDVFFRTNNLRKLADDANRHITKWFRSEFDEEYNIVATDYFLGNDMINVAIEANTR